MALVTEHACRLLGADFATVALVEPSGAITRRGTRGSVSEAWQTIVTRVPRNSGLTVALRTGKTVVIDCIGENPDFPVEELPVQHAEGLRTSITTPCAAEPACWAP
jgi:GAF domain-containing protein